MTFVIPCSSGCVTLLTKSTFAQRRDIKLARYNVSRRPSNPSFSNHGLLLPKLASLRLLKKHFYGSHMRDASWFLLPKAVGADVATEEQNSSVSDEGTDALPEKSSPAEEKSTDETEETSSVSASVPPVTQSRRSRPARKSEMPPVNNEELAPGASFTGKVRSIQPFGAFVDFGAFTDGLVHVSKLSNAFVKDVADVVSVGQEVKVRIVEANMETGRISLSMRDDDSGISQPRKESSDGGNKPRTDRRNNARSQRRNDSQKVSKFTKGQVLDGTVKNLTRAGAYISLPDGEEGFLPSAEESEGFGNILGSSNLQAGQEVNVRVLRISRGQVTLTMKKEEDVEAINKQLNQGVVHTASNPFMLAFRKNKDIAAFLDEREKSQESVKAPEQLEEKVESQTQDLTSGSANTKFVDQSEVGTVESSISSEVATDEAISDTMMSEESVPSTDHTKPQESVVMEEDRKSQTPEFATDASSETNADTGSDSSSQVVEEIKENTESLFSEDVPSENDQAVSGTLSSEESVPSADSSEPEASIVTEEDKLKETSELAIDATPEPNAGTESDSSQVVELEENTVPLVPQEDGPVANSAREETLIVNDSGEASSGTESKAEVDGATLTTKISESEASVENQAESTIVDEKVEIPVLSVEGTAETTANAVTAETSQQQETNDAVSNGQISTTQENSAKATISPALVKQLREESGAGMMDCKKALAETGGDIAKAQEFLRKKGLASADKKASRATAEGRIGSYIHDNRIGVLIEVNCETDFVSRGEIFKELVDDLAMQVAACPQVKYLVTEDVPEETVNKEREIEMQKEDLLSKPEQIREKIVDGRINKRLQEFALLEQPYIKNDKVVVKDWVKQTIATIGENIKVKRFIRYNLGEGLQKKSQDFAAEVAAQTAAKESPTVPKEQPLKSEETVQKPPSVAISAKMVKQLREETGAGMMDCKKALAETSGNLEAAQEYLRKKGLSSADKKSSRLAAEGRISSYIHDSRIGVLIEVNSETDFVARNEKFKELVDDLAMQVAACPQVQFVSLQEIPESEVAKEKEIEMQREDLKSKPENIREKIVEGRVSKRLGELALLEQPFIKDDSVLVKDLVKQTVATLGENIRVRRFARFNLGE